MKKKNRDERLSQVSDALFGSPSDISAAEAIEDLEAAGVNREDLHSRMYEKLCALAREYRLKQEQVPVPLRKALEELRTRMGPPRTKEEMDRRADSTISKLLDAVKSPISRAFPKLEFNTSFRNKAAEQPAGDRRIIENLEKELASDLEKEEKEH